MQWAVSPRGGGGVTVDTAAAAPAQLDYIATTYDLAAGHVFDVLTIDRLNLILKSEGKSVVVFADPLNEASKTAIPAINTVAKAKGINVYYFDMILAGEFGVNLWNNPEAYWPDVITSGTTAVTQAFVGASKYLKANTPLNGVDSSFVAKDNAYLFVSNDGVIDQSTDVLFTDKSDKASAITAALETVMEDGKSVATNFEQYDYFNDAIWEISKYSDDPEYKDYSAYKNNFKLRSVTYYELRALMAMSGEHNILMSGSWCGDSKRALPIIARESSINNSDTVYVFDFRLTNSTPLKTKDETLKNKNGTATNGRETSVIEIEGNRADIVNGAGGSESTLRDFVTRVGHLGAKLMEAFGKDFPTGINPIFQYSKDGKLSETNAVEFSRIDDQKFRSPFLIRFDKSAAKPVVKAWLRKVTSWDVSVADYEEGTLLDYEMTSATVSNMQEALGRYECALFFGAKEIKYDPPVPNIIDGPSSGDSGCGDDNDAMDNMGEDQLIPNHGSDFYDVSHYDIDITFQPNTTEPVTGDTTATRMANATFKGITAIKAKALKELDGAVTFDMRALTVSGITVKTFANAEDKVGTVVEGITWTQTNKDDIDKQKLNVFFAGKKIAKDTLFEVEVTYTTITIDKAINQGNKSPQGFSTHMDGRGVTAAGEPFGSTYWFPNNNTPADGATYKVMMTAPEAYTSVSNGVRTSIKSSGVNNITTWEVKQNTAGYQMFATFSDNLTEMTHNNDAAGSVERFFETADGVRIPIFCFVNTTLYRANKNKMDRYFGMLSYYTKTLENRFGAYPGESLGYIFENLSNGSGEPAGWGAIETKDRPFYTYTSVVGENTFVHELAHQWYGDAVRLADWNSLWLNEGFATYASDLFYEDTQGASSFEKYKTLWSDTIPTSYLWKTAPAALDDESDMFGGVKSAYNRGAMALVILRKDIGDAKFFETMQKWPKENKGGSANTEDFVALAERISGKDLSTFSAVWLYGNTKPATFNLDGGKTYVVANPSIPEYTGSGTRAITINGATVASLASLKVNGVAVAKTSYSVAASGSNIIITLNEAYLKTLPAGTTKFVADFGDGVATFSLKVADKATPEGDDKTEPSTWWIWLIAGIVVVGAAGAVTFVVLKKKKNK